MNKIIDYMVITNVVTTEADLKEFQDAVRFNILSGGWKPLGGVEVATIKYTYDWKLFGQSVEKHVASYSQALIKVQNN